MNESNNMTPDEQARALVVNWLSSTQQHNDERVVGFSDDELNDLESGISSALRAACSTWTDERPTEPGLWLFLESGEEQPEAVRVVLIKQPTASLTALFTNCRMENVAALRGQWARIEIPDEPAIRQREGA